MEWFIVQAQDLHGMFSSLGSFIGNEYYIGENCLASLGEILSYLSTEDRTMRNFRRALGVSQLIQTDLIPLLMHAKDDMKIMDATIRVLVNLTLPVECLLSLESLSHTKCGRQTISDLNHLLENVKQAFVDPRVTSCLIQRMRSTIDAGRKLLPEECESIGNCLLLLRNILHVPDNKTNKVHGKPWHTAIDSNGNGASSGTSNQNLILWNIFAQNIDKVLLHLMTCPQRAEWDVPMVQLVALTYKDQHMASLLKMLQLWLETSMNSESSEDNESNTSPQPLSQGSENSSPVLTSEATSDSSDNGGAANEGEKKLQKGERSKGACEEDEESVQHTFMNPSMNSLDDKHKDCKGNQESSQSCAAGQEKNIKKENVNDGKPEKHSEEEKEQDCQKREDMKAKKVEEEENINTDKDSGVFSQDSSHNWNSDKKGHMPSHQRHYHHQHHPHRYPHHHRSHLSHSTNKKDSTGASSTSINHPKGNAVSELSDCGYSTQRENQPESLSTSSNEDEGPIAKRNMKPGHQKHHLRQHHKLDSNKLTNANCGHPVKVQKINLRRKRLVKRIHSANVKGVLHHTPTDEDISNLLKEFTLDFLLQGYGPLVSGLHMKLLSCCTHRAPGVHPSSTASIICSKPSILPSSPTIFHSSPPELPPPPIDTSHFFWLITFFLRFSSQLELELEHISMVLSYDILSYLVYEGVGLCEEVELALLHCKESDVKPCLRRIHLVVTAIREFVQAVESYEKMAMNIPGREGDKVYLQMLKRQMAATRDLRCLFVLLLQHYNPSVMSKQYLQDVVVTNHVLLLFLEGGNGINSSSNSNTSNRRVGRKNSLIEEVDMMDHIQHFANRGIVQKYGQLLAAFQENGEFVNDCVFTMLHHIGGGEVNRPETLFQPTLLRAFSAMWESDFDMCDDWSDLIEYIIHKFISNPQHGMSPKNPGIGIIPVGLPLGGNILVSDKKEPEESENKWTMEDLRDLRWFYAQSCRENSVLAKIVKLYRQKSGVTKSRIEVLNQLLSQKIIDSNQYASLKRAELPGEGEDKFIKPFSPPTPVSMHENFDGAEHWSSEDVNEISKLKDLINEGLEKEIHWLQGALLEACYVKLWMKKQKEGASYDPTNFHVMEPVPYHYALMGQPIPIIPWGIEERRAVIQNSTFCQLLHCLGIQKPREDGIGGIYPRIPTSFTPLDLLEAAKKLGGLTTGNMKFDPAELNPMELEEETGENFKVPSEALHRNPDNKSPVHFHNTPPQLSPQPARCSLQKSPSEINIMATANSNINWLSIVGRSKNLSHTEKLPLKKETEENEEACDGEERDTNIPPKEEHC